MIDINKFVIVNRRKSDASIVKKTAIYIEPQEEEEKEKKEE